MARQASSYAAHEDTSARWILLLVPQQPEEVVDQHGPRPGVLLPLRGLRRIQSLYRLADINVGTHSARARHV